MIHLANMAIGGMVGWLCGEAGYGIATPQYWLFMVLLVVCLVAGQVATRREA